MALRVRGAWLAILLAGAACPLTGHAQQQTEVTPETLTDEQVVGAINKGVDYLLKDVDQKLMRVRRAPEADRGKAELLGAEPGELMLEAYALLHTGQELRDARLAYRDERMQLLKDVVTRFDSPKNAVHETYATALQALALSQMPKAPEVSGAMRRAASRLVAGMQTGGGYNYNLDESAIRPDMSNSQYGLLGTWAAADWGMPIPANYWKITDDFWRKGQLASGDWAYASPSGDKTPRQSMTAAGVASLFVCSEFLDRTPRTDMQGDKALEAGLAALVAKFNPTSDDLYYAYGLERVGLASGLKYYGKVNWYRTIAAHLVRSQDKNGVFPGSWTEANAVRSTCYAILFLVRGRSPIVMNKLQYDGSWNDRPRDSASVHNYLARIFERRLNWQVVPMDVGVDEWMDAPVLFITGAKDPAFLDAQVAKLREFVQRGGIIFSVAEGGRREFTDAMAGYAARVVPETAKSVGTNWRELPRDHPLYTVIGRPDPLPHLMGVSNGVRELWIHSSDDYSAIWQTRNETDKNAWEMPARIFMYVASKNGLRSKLQPLTVASPATAPAGKLRMVQVEFSGNWNPEPLAWERMGRVMALQGKTSLAIETIPATRLADAGKPALVHLAGVGALKLTEDERNALGDYVNGGGTLFVEAIGGDKTFAADAKELLTKLFGDAKLRAMPADYLFYAGGFAPGAMHIDEVEYRKNWVLEHGAQTKPRLQYMTIGGRVGVIFSEEDITQGLLGMNTWGIGGYVPESAVMLARNIVLFAGINQKR